MTSDGTRALYALLVRHNRHLTEGIKSRANPATVRIARFAIANFSPAQRSPPRPACSNPGFFLAIQSHGKPWRNMAPSLQVLIDFLLAEIALCGDQGRSFFFFASLRHVHPLLQDARWVIHCITCDGFRGWMIWVFPSTA